MSVVPNLSIIFYKEECLLMTQLVIFLFVPISLSTIFINIIKPFILSKFCKSDELRMKFSERNQKWKNLFNIA